MPLGRVLVGWRAEAVLENEVDLLLQQFVPFFSLSASLKFLAYPPLP